MKIFGKRKMVGIVRLSNEETRLLVERGYVYVIRSSGAKDAYVNVICNGIKIGNGYVKSLGKISYTKEGIYVRTANGKVPLSIFDESLLNDVVDKEKSAKKDKLCLAKVTLLNVRKRSVKIALTSSN